MSRFRFCKRFSLSFVRPLFESVAVRLTRRRPIQKVVPLKLQLHHLERREVVSETLSFLFSSLVPSSLAASHDAVAGAQRLTLPPDAFAKATVEKSQAPDLSSEVLPQFFAANDRATVSPSQDPDTILNSFLSPVDLTNYLGAQSDSIVDRAAVQVQPNSSSAPTGGAGATNGPARFEGFFVGSIGNAPPIDIQPPAPTPTSMSSAAPNQSSNANQASAPLATPVRASTPRRDQAPADPVEQNPVHHRELLPGPSSSNSSEVDAEVYVVDVHRGAVLSTVVKNHTFAKWDEDLRAQVYIAQAVSFEWDFSKAGDAKNITGDDTYRVQFNWQETLEYLTNTVTLTVDFGGSTEIVQDYVFQVGLDDSPAWLEAPTQVGGWPDVMTPDMLQATSAVMYGPHHSVDLVDGSVSTAIELPIYNPGSTPARLVYNSMTANPQPVFVARYELNPSKAVPDTIDAELTVDGDSQGTFSYNTSLMNPGNFVQFSLPADANSLVTGRYDWEIELTLNYKTPDTKTFKGQFNLINDSDSPFGAGWWLEGLDRLIPVDDGVMIAMAGNRSLYFKGVGPGKYDSPAGEFSSLTYSDKSEVWTRTFVNGVQQRFNGNGALFETEDRNGNKTTYVYSSGAIETITDYVDLENEFEIVGGELQGISDGAGREFAFEIVGDMLTEYTDSASDVWEFDYDASGMLETIVDPRAESTEFSYWQNTVTVEEADGAFETVSPLQNAGYPEVGVTVTAIMTAQAGSTVVDGESHYWFRRHDWAGFGQTMQLTDPLFNVGVSYHDRNGLMWLDSDPLSRREVYHHDDDGSVVRITWADDNDENYERNAFGQVEEFIDARNNSWLFTYGTTGNLDQSKTPEGNITAYTYNTDGFVESMTDPRTNTTTYTLDGRNRVTLIEDPEGGEVEFTYNADSTVETMTDQRDFVTLYKYDEMNRVTKVTLPDEDANANNNPVYEYKYVGGLLDTVTDPLDHETTYKYDPVGRLQTVTDALDHSKTYQYDLAGNLIGLLDALDHAVTFEYDAANRLIAKTGELERMTTYDRDAAGQLLEVVDPESGATTFRYNERGWVTLVVDPTDHAILIHHDENGNPTSEDIGLYDRDVPLDPWYYYCPDHCLAAYDLDNRRTSTTSANGTTAVTFDEASNVTKVSMACGCSTMSEGIYTYDKLNRKISSANNLDLTTDFKYDKAGNLLSSTDPLGHATTYQYDAQNRLKSMTDAEDRSTLFAYHLDGQLKSVTDPENNVTSYKYDEANRLIEITDPNGKTTTNKYDAADRLTDVYDRIGRRMEFIWDAADRKTGELWYDLGSKVVNTITYDYDDSDRLKLASDDHATNNFTHFPDGRLKTENNHYTTDMPEIELTYSYGSEDSMYAPVLGRVDDDLGASVIYRTNEAGRLFEARMEIDSTTVVAKAVLTYTAQNWLDTVTLTDSTNTGEIVSDYGHDNAGRLETITHTFYGSSTITLSSFEYVYDKANRIEVYNGPEGTREYLYDKTNQLLEVSEPGVGVLEEFDYDDNGNRDMSGYVTDTGNRMTSDGTFDYEYDLEGNMVSKVKISNGEDTTFTWDHRNRLVDLEVRTSKGALLFEEEYSYDVFNRRIRVQTDTDGDSDVDEDRWTAYDGANPWADFDGNGDMTTRYLNGREMDQRFARYDVDSEETAFYLTDNINSVRQIAQVDNSTPVIYSANYTAFGVIASQSGAGGDRFKFTGRELDASGLYYYRARYYGAGVGRFVSEDPISFAGGDANLYRYVGNAPSTKGDPSGLWSFWGGLGGTIVGGGLGFFIGGPLGAGIGASLGGGLGSQADQFTDTPGEEFVFGCVMGIYGGVIGGKVARGGSEPPATGGGDAYGGGAVWVRPYP